MVVNLLNYSVILFFLVFGPLLDIGLGQLGDVSFLISLLIIFYTILHTKLEIPKYLIFCLSITVCISIIALLNSFVFDVFEVEVGLRAILRPVRVFFVVLSCFCFVKLIEEKMLSLNISQHERLIILVQLLYVIILLHGLLMCLQFVFPDLRDYVYRFTYAKYQLEYNKLFRMAGLTGAGGAQTSFVQGLGCLLGWFLFFCSSYKHKIYVLFGNILLIVSIILSGRTGLIVVFLGFFFFLFLSLFDFTEKLKLRTSHIFLFFIPFVFTMLFIGSVPDLLGDNYKYFETAFNRTFKTIIDLFETGSFEDDTISALSKMLIIPDDFLHLLFGKSSYLEGNTYYNIMTDIGYLRLVWGYGLLGLFMHIFFYLLLLLRIFKFKFNSFVDMYFYFLPVILIFFVFIMNTKEIFFFTRTSSHIIFIIVFYYILSYRTILRKESS